MNEIPKQTFQEAFDEIEELSFVRDESKPVIEQEWVNGHTAVYALIEELQENYAPTVEMTQQQKDLLLHFKETTWFSLFLAKFNDPEFGESLPDLSCFDGWGVSKERENDLLTAWLHPESIKVVD
ncbi:hypothetical protein [Fructobacillus cardui]|uniref:DUF1642 domain-containing protein n=1 Tax=Fructobacillus cardui TaxID=2893170 RepID=A0ABM9N2I5_9LACO|nr:hypothetical protein R82641_BJNNKPBH_01598 [Fructobacillus cardui]